MAKGAVKREPTPATSKRDLIQEAATRVFLDEGYGAASMDSIAAQAGVSKQTIYSYFSSKEALYGAIVRDKCDEFLDSLIPSQARDDDPGKVLTFVGQTFLRLLLVPDNMRHYRAVVAESTRFPELAQAFYDSGPRLAADNLAAYLAESDRKGVLRIPEPLKSARLFFAMMRGDLYLRQVLGLGPDPAPEEADEAVRDAVSVFLAAHTP